MAHSQIYVGLEIGTSKTCMVVGEVYPDSSASILGVGEIRSAGVRKGEVYNRGMALQCVRDALDRAQDNANVDIVNVYLSVTGAHIYGETNMGSYRLPDDESIIEEKHVSVACEKADHLEIAPDRIIFNRERSGFSIDDREPVSYPEGLTGRTLDVKCHLIHGISTRLQDSLCCVREVPLEVAYLVFAPLATAQMVLDSKQKAAGALLIDIGAGTSDFICYKNGEIVASGCIPAGGNTINHDIVTITRRVSNEAAEALKCTEGNAFGDVQDRSLAQYRTDLGLHDVAIPRGELNRIIRDRLADILIRIKNRIPDELWRNGGLEVYFSGGTSLMRGLEPLATHIFGVPVHQPAPLPSRDVANYQYLADPRYCTAIGLIRYAQKREDDLSREEGGSWFDWLRSLFFHSK